MFRALLSVFTELSSTAFFASTFGAVASVVTQNEPAQQAFTVAAAGSLLVMLVCMIFENRHHPVKELDIEQAQKGSNLINRIYYHPITKVAFVMQIAYYGVILYPKVKHGTMFSDNGPLMLLMFAFSIAILIHSSLTRKKVMQ